MSKGSALWEFLSEAVPPTGTREWEEWKSSACRVATDKDAQVIEVLRFGDENEQYAAILTLRLLGYEAFGVGHGRALKYRFRKVGEAQWTEVVPLSPPEDGPPAGGYAVGIKPF